MPTRRLDESGDRVERWPCRSPDHNVPSHMVFEDGSYEHTCSGCGRRLIFHVQHPKLL